MTTVSRVVVAYFFLNGYQVFMAKLFKELFMPYSRGFIAFCPNARSGRSGVKLNILFKITQNNIAPIWRRYRQPFVPGKICTMREHSYKQADDKMHDMNF